MARRCAGQATLICEGMLGDNASTEDMLNLWAVRMDDVREAIGAPTGHRLVCSNTIRINTQGTTP